MQIGGIGERELKAGRVAVDSGKTNGDTEVGPLGSDYVKWFRRLSITGSSTDYWLN